MKQLDKYQVQRGIPMPETHTSSIAKAVSALQVGESFEFDSELRGNCYSAAKYQQSKTLDEFGVTIRKVNDETSRVWRTR